MMNIEDYDGIYKIVRSLIEKCRKLQSKYDINVSLKFTKIDVENIDWVIYNLEKYNILTVYKDIDNMRIEINVDNLEIEISGVNKYTHDGKLMSCEFNWSIDGSDCIDTELAFYIHENCENCKNWRTPVWDHDNKYHEQDSKIGYVDPENDVEGKGGIGYWTFARKKKDKEWTFTLFSSRNLYKHNELTALQKVNLLGCRYAFCEGCPMGNNKINTLRQIKLHTISKKAATTYDHCKYFNPNDGVYNVGNHPVKLIMKRDGFTQRKWGTIQNQTVEITSEKIEKSGD